MSLRPPAKPRFGPEQAEVLAVEALTWLAAEPERLSRFLGLSGLDVVNLRREATQKGFLAGVIAYVASDEPLLLDLAAATGRRPEEISAAHHLLNGPFDF